MKVEIKSDGNLLSIQHFHSWIKFESYVLRWLSQPVHIRFVFEHLQEQVMWYSDLTDLINCARLAQESIVQNPWEVTIYGFDKAVKIFNDQAA